MSPMFTTHHCALQVKGYNRRWLDNTGKVYLLIGESYYGSKMIIKKAWLTISNTDVLSLSFLPLLPPFPSHPSSYHLGEASQDFMKGRTTDSKLHVVSDQKMRSTQGGRGERRSVNKPHPRLCPPARGASCHQHQTALHLASRMVVWSSAQLKDATPK